MKFWRKKGNIEDKLYDLKKQYGFFKRVKLRETDKTPHFTAGINLMNHDLHINYNPKFDPESDNRLKWYMKVKNVHDPVEAILRDLLIHELGHWSHRRGKGRGCPQTIDMSESHFLDPITTALKRNDKENYAHFLVGVVQDWINDTMCKTDSSKTGDIFFYDDVGKTTTKIVPQGDSPEEKAEYMINLEELIKEGQPLPENVVRKYTSSYEAFIKLQMYSWGDSIDNTILSKYYKNDEIVINAVQNIIRRLGLNMKRRTLVGNKNITYRDKESICNYLVEPRNWKHISTVFAEEFIPLLEDEDPQEPLFGAGGSFEDSDEPGDGSGQKPGEKPGDKPGQGSGGKKKRFRSPQESAMNDPSNRSRFAMRRMQNHEGPPSYMEKFEYLDLIYQNLAKHIPIIAQTLNETSVLPTTPYGYEAFNSEDHEIDQVNFHRFMLDDGDINFGVAQHHFELPIRLKKGVIGFPKIKMGLLDTSGSMGQGIPDAYQSGDSSIIPWGDKSKYHYALMSWYGTLQFLAEHQILPYVDVSLTNFSSHTHVAEGLRESKALALAPQFGSTYLNIDKVSKFFKGPDAVIFTMSDGDIFNWDTIKDEYLSLAKTQKYFHIQMGPDETFTRDMKAAGLMVKHVDKGEDLVNMSIDLTSAAYGDYFREHGGL